MERGQKGILGRVVGKIGPEDINTDKQSPISSFKKQRQEDILTPNKNLNDIFILHQNSKNTEYESSHKRMVS